MRRAASLFFWLVLSICPAVVLAQAAAPAVQAPPAAPPQTSQATPAAPPIPPPGYPPPGYAPGWYGPPPGYGPGWYGAPPSAPQPEVGAYRHDGFYLRLGTGIAYGHVGSSGTLSYGSNTSSDLSATYTGWGPAYELLIGGTVGRGLVLGGGFVGQDISDPTLSVDSDELSGEFRANGSLGVGAFGPFIDWFPDEGKGLHLGTMIGVALLGLGDGSGDTSSGVAGALWGGYDFWVSSQWSLGAEARLAALRASRNISGYSGTLHDQAISAELLFTALYH